MKGGLTTFIVAAETSISEDPGHGGAIEISATTNKEAVGFSGVAFFAKKDYFNSKKVNHVIISEPLNKE